MAHRSVVCLSCPEKGHAIQAVGAYARDLRVLVLIHRQPGWFVDVDFTARFLIVAGRTSPTVSLNFTTQSTYVVCGHEAPKSWTRSRLPVTPLEPANQETQQDACIYRHLCRRLSPITIFVCNCGSSAAVHAFQPVGGIFPAGGRADCCTTLFLFSVYGVLSFSFPGAWRC